MSMSIYQYAYISISLSISLYIYVYIYIYMYMYVDIYRNMSRLSIAYLYVKPHRQIYDVRDYVRRSTLSL